MAKPIAPTPILDGKDAKRFLEIMLKEQVDPDPKRIKFIREALESSKKFHVKY